jgi:hypothetical protein
MDISDINTPEVENDGGVITMDGEFAKTAAEHPDQI